MNKEPPAVRASFNPSSNRYLAGVKSEYKEVAIAIAAKADTVRGHAEDHFQKHQREWIKDERDNLVAKHGQFPEPKPRNAPPRDFDNEAARNVRGRHAVRIARITLKERNMTRSLTRDNDCGR